MTLIEKACEVAYPLLIGIAIDGLLAGRNAALVPLIAVWSLHLGVGVTRHMYDTRVFARIYGELAGTVVVQQRGEGEDVATVAARVSLSREIINFFEVEIPAIVTVIVTGGGSLLMLFWLDWRIGAMALAAMVPIVFLSRWFGGKALILYQRLNNRLEREVAVVASAQPQHVERHFRVLKGWRVKISDLQASTWGWIEVVLILLTLSALLILASTPEITAGTIYAILAYIFDLHNVARDMPTIVHNIAQTTDIAQRLRGADKLDKEIAS